MKIFAILASSRFQSCLLESAVSISGCAQHLEELFEVGGERGFELDVFFGHRVLKGKLPRVERLTRKAPTHGLCPRVGQVSPLAPGIEDITDDGVADVGHVDADLVGTAGDRSATHQEGSCKRLLDPVQGAGWPSLGDDRHFLTVARMTVDRSVNDSIGGFRRSVTYREIGLSNRVPAKGDRQCEVGAVGLGDRAVDCRRGDRNAAGQGG